MQKALSVVVLSFGYKFGLPHQADFILDVRFLPNPYYDRKLQHLSGKDEPVREYVLKQSQTQKFLSLVFPFLEYVVPQFEKKGKNRLILAVGCTGGRHRSIVVADEIFRFFLEKQYPVRVKYRDIHR